VSKRKSVHLLLHAYYYYPKGKSKRQLKTTMRPGLSVLQLLLAVHVTLLPLPPLKKETLEEKLFGEEVVIGKSE
jgi:hypothetical protein